MANPDCFLHHNEMTLSRLMVTLLIIMLLAACNHNDGPGNLAKIEWGSEQLLKSLMEAGYKDGSGGNVTLDISVDEGSGLIGEESRHEEGFGVEVKNDHIEIRGYDAAGAMYGCLGLADQIKRTNSLPDTFRVSDSPMMKLRGVCILLMKLGTYNYPVTPEEFPFFYDKALWLDYLDFLASNRYNYIALWNGHPFAYFVTLDKYPEAQQGMDPMLIKRNHDMLLWLIREGQKRNIRFMFEFYNIHTSVYFQKAHDLPDENPRPTPLLEEYTAYCLETFVREFPDVGLYVTPGEGLEPEFAPQWLNEVIFPAVRRTGKTPPIMLRAWGIELEHARQMVDPYPNLYIERKYNVEMIADTRIDPENKEWARLNGNHVVNIHCVANLEPFRWNPPAYIRKCMQSSMDAGANGLHLYPRKAWRWPYGCDRDSDQLQWERDALWFRMWGRYAWSAERDPDSERLFWKSELERRFGSGEAAGHFLKSFESGADILPALQRLFWLGHDNHTVVSAGTKLSQIEHAGGVPFLPLEDVERVSLYLKSLKSGDDEVTNSPKSPVRFLEIKVKEAETALEEALAGARTVVFNRDEAERIVSDARAVRLLARFYHSKMQATEARARYEYNSQPEHWKELVKHLNTSVDLFRELTQLTTLTYESISDVPAISPERLKTCPYHWRDVLPVFEKELAVYKEDVEFLSKPGYQDPVLPGLAGIWYGDPGLKSAKGPDPVLTLDLDWTDRFAERERRWSGRWFGYLKAPVSGTVTFLVRANQGVQFRLDKITHIAWDERSGEKTVSVKMQKGLFYPVEIVYDHKDGREAFLTVMWKWDKDFEPIPVKKLWHSPGQKREMERSVLLNLL